MDAAGITIRDATLEGADLRSVVLSGARLRGVEMADVQISGEVERLVVNGVDVAPLVQAELDRRDPERRLMRATTAEELREGWAALERLWEGTVARAQALAPELLHASVDGEWSFIQTLRHLAFATESWLLRAIQGDPAPWDPLSLPWDEAPPIPGVPHDRDAQPDLGTVLRLRQDRMARVRAYLSTLTDEGLVATTTPVDAPGWPEPQAFVVGDCLRVILNEEWEHRRFAERDLDLLTRAG